MPFFIPEQLSSWSGGKWHDLPKDPVRGFSIDARNLEEGEMFVAIEAERDGHDYVEQALENGASSALVNRLQLHIPIPQLLVENTLKAFQEIALTHRNDFQGLITGITGSCGKTTTKEVLSLLLGRNCHRTEGNFNNYLGVPLTLSKLDLSNDYGVIEVGINKIGEMSELARILSPNLVLITMIGISHLEGLVNLETIASEKAKIFEDSFVEPKVIFHHECLQYEPFRLWRQKGNPHVTLIEGDVDNQRLSCSTAFYEIWTETNTIGDSCMLRLWRHESPVLVTPIPAGSRGMHKNIALSILAACEQGISHQRISERLPQYRPSTLRAASFLGRGRTYFVDCYNANPSSMKDSIEFFSTKFQGTPKLYVFGGMEELGEQGMSLHEEVGATTKVEPADLFVMIGEKASWIAPGLLSSGAVPEQLMILKDLDSARSLVEDFHGAVLLKGSRSHGLEELLPSWAVEEEKGLEC
ncbi:MAG: UDP-N-acetylmuramoyl-tripeptide--D-alanyl-D-alanine ligase [Opitutales bacterium]|nr:UDP-N-acetylmuramoyl-tripeptide--D-alanyl-D-alanine ligase [Opitutales bacterium]